MFSLSVWDIYFFLGLFLINLYFLANNSNVGVLENNKLKRKMSLLEVIQELIDQQRKYSFFIQIQLACSRISTLKTYTKCYIAMKYFLLIIYCIKRSKNSEQWKL